MRAAAPWFVAGLIVLTALWAAPVAIPVSFHAGVPVGYGHASPPIATPPKTIRVNMTDAPAFAPSRIAVDSGANITFQLANLGAYPHTFTMAQQSGAVLSPSWTPTQLDHYFAVNGSFVNVSVAPGRLSNVSWSVPVTAVPLSFEFVSVVPYQFQSGMSGLVTVTPTIGGNATVSDNTTDALSFVPNAIELNTSGLHFPVNVTISVQNLGALVHTWTLVPQPGVNITPQNFSNYFAVHPALANVQVPSSGQGTGNFLVAQSGVYEFICEEPGHFQSGMFGFLYVNVPVPPTVTVSTAIVSAWILAVAFGLIGIGVVLAAIVGFTGRFPKPPENEDGHY